MNPIIPWICGGILIVAVLVALFRVERGPSMLDRIVALDVLVAAVIGTLTLWSAITGRVDLVPILTGLAIVGFMAAVTLARFAATEPEEEGRILSLEEVREVERDRVAEIDAELEEEASE